MHLYSFTDLKSNCGRQHVHNFTDNNIYFNYRNIFENNSTNVGAKLYWNKKTTQPKTQHQMKRFINGK